MHLRRGVAPRLGALPRTPPPLRRRFVILCVKDGKKKRPKAADPKSTPSTPPSTPTDPPPPRITTNSLIDVRKQIKLVKLFKEAQTQPMPSPFRVRAPQYRRPSKTAEEFRQERAEAEAVAAALSNQESKRIALQSLYGSYQPLKGMYKLPPVLLVDGYNVLHVWDRTKEMMQRAGEIPLVLQDAREALLDSLGVYSQINGVRVVVAFDALNTGVRMNSEEVLPTGVTVVYCGECEADSYIEDQVDLWLKKRHPSVVVATSDVAHKSVIDSKTPVMARQTVWVVPSSGLCKDMLATEKRMDQRLADYSNKQKVHMGILGSTVKSRDKSTFSALNSMRMADVPQYGLGARRRQPQQPKTDVTE